MFRCKVSNKSLEVLEVLDRFSLDEVEAGETLRFLPMESSVGTHREFSVEHSPVDISPVGTVDVCCVKYFCRRSSNEVVEVFISCTSVINETSDVFDFAIVLPKSASYYLPIFHHSNFLSTLFSDLYS